MPSIGVVGAGAAAAAATYALDGAAPSADVTVLEKSRGVCGRAATRRRGDVTYDYGANYVTSDDERVAALLTDRLGADGLVDVTDPIYTFDDEGTVSEGRGGDGHKWTYRAGLTQIAKRLLGETGATLHRETRVERLVREGERWRVVDSDGGEWGPFDALLLNPPAPQTAALLRDAAGGADASGASDERSAPDASHDGDEPTAADARAALAEAAAAVSYRTIWTAVLHYPFELDRPYYALINPDRDHEIGWIAREECKPGHVPAGESLLVVQANPEWSVARYDDDPAENVADLAALTADVLGDDRLADPDWTDHQRWRYALPDEGVRRRAVADARAVDLYPVGDWVAGEARVHAALRNGLETGERVAESL